MSLHLPPFKNKTTFKVKATSTVAANVLVRSTQKNELVKAYPYAKSVLNNDNALGAEIDLAAEYVAAALTTNSASFSATHTQRQSNGNIVIASVNDTLLTLEVRNPRGDIVNVGGAPIIIASGFSSTNAVRIAIFSNDNIMITWCSTLAAGSIAGRITDPYGTHVAQMAQQSGVAAGQNYSLANIGADIIMFFIDNVNKSLFIRKWTSNSGTATNLTTLTDGNAISGVCAYNLSNGNVVVLVQRAGTVKPYRYDSSGVLTHTGSVALGGQLYIPADNSHVEIAGTSYFVMEVSAQMYIGRFLAGTTTAVHIVTGAGSSVLHVSIAPLPNGNLLVSRVDGTSSPIKIREYSVAGTLQGSEKILPTGTSFVPTAGQSTYIHNPATSQSILMYSLSNASNNKIAMVALDNVISNVIGSEIVFKTGVSDSKGYFDLPIMYPDIGLIFVKWATEQGPSQGIAYIKTSKSALLGVTQTAGNSGDYVDVAMEGNFTLETDQDYGVKSIFFDNRIHSLGGGRGTWLGRSIVLSLPETNT